jgi:hypothetical protein
MNKPGGVMARIGSDGKPTISPKSNLNGVKVADVKGWAPTKDGLNFGFNSCTGDRFEGFDMIIPGDTYTTTIDGTSYTLYKANDISLAMLLDGSVDAVWIYADQAKNYDCNNLNGAVPSWECAIWSKFKTSFAFIHTGIYEHAKNGTTLTLARKGSGVAELVNPCIQKFLKT